MFKLEGKYVRVNNHEELDCLFEYANKHGWRWRSDGSELNTSFGDCIAYPFIICFKNNKKVDWNPCNSNTDFKDIEKNILIILLNWFPMMIQFIIHQWIILQPLILLIMYLVVRI